MELWEHLENTEPEYLIRVFQSPNHTLSELVSRMHTANTFINWPSEWLP